ncbi:hypothetical protein ACE2AJ_00555 [Aquihabitans daechungensis]|uniref:hypothetical protein n=1 Tax=Aquihabitans daechungensis TaxID=1052257 RepID=UPI003BA1B697
MASPAEVSWADQSTLAARGIKIGRLDPALAGIEHYLASIRNGWKQAEADPATGAVWSADHDAMTAIMRAALADRLTDRLRESGTTMCATADGESDGLLEILRTRPGFVLTTSHGALPDSQDPAATLGVPCDKHLNPLDVDAVVDAAPGGALWMIQACNSAGSTRPSVFAPLYADEPGDQVLGWLQEVERSAPLVAPLPNALLGSDRPARGVIAQVELTFDWMLVELDDWAALPTGRPLTDTLITGIENVIAGDPAGTALVDHQNDASGFMQQRLQEQIAWNGDGEGDAESTHLWKAFWYDLVARNRRATVLLGDPAVAFT